MAQKLTQRTTNPNPLTLADIIHAVSVADTTQSPQGSSYKNTLQALMNLIKKSGVGNFFNGAPTINDDITQGWIMGSFWFDENAQKLYILNDNSAGAADWVNVVTMQSAYDGGNVVNGADVVIDGDVNIVVAIGFEAALDNSGSEINAFGLQSGKNNSGISCNFIGSKSGEDNQGDFANGIGVFSLIENTGENINAFGRNAGRKNTANNSNFFGLNAGYQTSGSIGNTTSHGVTVFSPESIPSFADQAAADAALTVANGCVAGQIYLWRLTGVTNVISFVIPT
jgi:hypothetical protein